MTAYIPNKDCDCKQTNNIPKPTIRGTGYQDQLVLACLTCGGKIDDYPPKPKQDKDDLQT